MLMLTQDHLKRCLSYNPDTGVFVWRNRPVEHFKDQRSCNKWNTQRAGKVAGGHDRYGYIRIILDTKRYQAHRLIWLYVHGEFPPGQIDHINGVRDDNRLENIRTVTQQQNLKNQRKRKDNSSGVTGVYWDRYRWMAFIDSGGKRTYLGRFKDKSDAIRARKEAEPEHGFHENHGR